MKTIRLILLSLSLVALTFTGCQSPEQAAYRTVATVTSSVDTAMNVWGDFVRADRATPVQEDQVRDAYVKYQAAMAVVREATIAAKTAPDGQSTYQIAIEALAASSAEIVRLVELFTKPPAE